MCWEYIGQHRHRCTAYPMYQLRRVKNMCGVVPIYLYALYRDGKRINEVAAMEVESLMRARAEKYIVAKEAPHETL